MEPDNVIERFWGKVEKTENCWYWTSALNKGYGVFSIKNKAKQAHRLAYIFTKGEIPNGLELDHLCETKNCVNPTHLEPVTHQENLRRSKKRWNNKTNCVNGHDYNEENTRINIKGSRYCLICHRESDKNYRVRSISYARG